MTDRSSSSGTVLAVATGEDGAGKTTTAVGLGATLAERGESVVVVDCDFDAPDLGDALGLDPETTLRDVLAGDAPVEDAIVETGEFAAVTAAPAADGEVDDDRFADAVARLRERFDAVILDVGADFWTAARSLRVADEAVVVTTPDPDALTAARQTAHLAADFDAEVVGAVVAWTEAGAIDDLEAVVPRLGQTPEVVVGVPDSEGVADARAAGRSVVAASPDGEAAAAYQDLASGLLDSGSFDAAAVTGDEADSRFEFGSTVDAEWADDSGPAASQPVADSDPQVDSDQTPESDPEGTVRRAGRLSAFVDLVVGGPDAEGRRPVAYDPESGLSASRRAVVAAVIAVQVALVALVVGDPSIPLVRPILGGFYAMFLPGLLVALLLDLDRCSFTRLVVYAVGLSAVVLLALGAVISLAYPVVGVANPFREGTVVATLTITTFGLSAAVLARDEGRRVVVPIQGAFAPPPLALLLIPFVSIFGITFQNVTGNSDVLLVMLLLLSVLPMLNARGAIPSRWQSLAVWATAAALLYHNSLFGPSIGGPSGSAATLESGYWSPSEESVLPNGVLFPTYVLLTGLRLGIEVSTLNPLLVSFLPVILFEGYREQVGDRAGFASACLFMFSFPFYVLYPSAGRVATPVFFLALMGLVLSDPEVDLLRKRVLGIAFGMGLGVSHYGTAYVAMVAFHVALIAYAAFEIRDRLRWSLARDGFRRRMEMDVVAGVKRLSPSFLSPLLVAFYMVFVVEWYFYTSGGDKFAILPRKVLSVVNRFFEASASGTAASAVSKDYGSVSIAMSRKLYILIGALMGAGIAATMLARLVRKDAVEVDDEFLALGVGFMSMLGTSFFVVGFNVARIMMIVFTFTAIYVVYGAGSAVEGLLLVRRVLGDALDRDFRGAVASAVHIDFDRALGAAKIETSAISVLLCVFLLLNAGVVTVFVTHDYAPSNIVTQEQLKQSEEVQVQLKAQGCVKCDIDSHVWLFAHRNRSKFAYGDYFAWAQVDFFRGPIASELSYFPKKITYRPLWEAANGTEGQSLILLLDHNTDTGVMLIGSKYYWKNLTTIEPVTNRSHRVYTTGETAIYRSTDRATEEAFDFELPEPTNVTNASRLHARIRNGTVENETNATGDGSENGTAPIGNVTTTTETPNATTTANSTATTTTEARNATDDSERRARPTRPDFVETVAAPERQLSAF